MLIKNKIKGIIVILGSSNNEQGKLSHFAVSRLRRGLLEYKKHQYHKVVLTGGYGNHFNTTSKPHAHYAKLFLLANGIPESDILEFAESRFTVEDAKLTKQIITKFHVNNLIIVSSDFHIKRVKYIFDQFFHGYQLEYVSAVTTVSKNEMNKLIHEEQLKLASLLNQSLVK